MVITKAYKYLLHARHSNVNSIFTKHSVRKIPLFTSNEERPMQISRLT